MMDFHTELENLKSRIESNSSDLSSVGFLESLPSLLEVLGETNANLRDDLGWSTLSKYFQSSLFPSSRRVQIIKFLSSSNFLFYEIANGETTSSVKRAFSVLALADVIYGDIDHGTILDKNDMSQLAEKVRTYLKTEKDRRGHVEGLGWVHAIAHTGDCISAINLHPNTPESEIFKNVIEILDFIDSIGFDVFKWDENFRLARPLGRAIEKLPPDRLKSLFDRYEGDFLYETPARQNILNTLRCVYVELSSNKFDKSQVFEQLGSMVR